MSTTKGHGRLERRTLTTSTLLNDYLDWPGVRQIYRLQRERQIKGKITRETVYGITSLARRQADADRLLELTQTHWHVENRLHWVRDMTFQEDACRVRSGSAPQILAAMRNLATYLLQPRMFPSIAAACRRFAIHPFEALQLIRSEN